MAEPGLEEVRRALAEDRAHEDVTTQLLGAAADEQSELHFVAEERFVVAGVRVALLAFRELDPDAQIETLVQEGDWVSTAGRIATVRATVRALLGAERVALNLMQRLSGVATETRRAVDAIAGTKAHITHTRKTTPGLRALEIEAVRLGGGVDNRHSLADAVMMKDNHWQRLGGSLAEAVKRAPAVPVIVEVESEAQLDEAVAAGVKHILIDNQTPERLAQWIKRAGPGITIQASGGITTANARAYAEAGADLIAIGAITHSAKAVSIKAEII